MSSLSDLLLNPNNRDRVMGDAVRLVESHVATRGGLRGMTLKTGLAVLKSAKPGIISRAVERLLPEFAAALDPLFQSFRTSGESDFSAYLQAHSQQATTALLAVADARVEQASSVVQTSYGRLRTIAESEVSSAIPALSRMIHAHLA